MTTLTQFPVVQMTFEMSSNARPLAHARANKTTALPLFDEKVSAGVPTYAQDYIRASLDINDILVRNPETTEYYQVSGDSMTGAGIYPNDIVAIDHGIIPKHGDIVLASYYGECLIKELYAKKNLCKLVAHNPLYTDIIIDNPDEFFIKGVLTGCVKVFQNLGAAKMRIAG